MININEHYDYRVMVDALCKSGSDIAKEANAHTMHMTHMAMGISGEVAELYSAVVNRDAENGLEEIGDVIFYATSIIDDQGIDLMQDNLHEERLECRELVEIRAERSIIACVTISGRIIDAVKKYSMYGQELNKELLSECIIELIRKLNHIVDYFGLTPQQVIDHNMAKLQLRYASGGYSDEEAKARNDK